ncbi:MAG: hypothetical protein KAR54_01225 [Candidatus Pacebacteria bacterium]|nr:hypothetical protein [Candidatus Paceibacterota bacterium]
MKKNILKIVFIFVLFAKYTVTNATTKTVEYTLLESSLPNIPDKTSNIGEYLQGIFILGVGLASVLAVLMIVIGGFKYMTAEASPFSIEEAKKNITNAILGLILILASWLLLNTISPDLINFNLNLKGVTLPEPKEPEHVVPFCEIEENWCDNICRDCKIKEHRDKCIECQDIGFLPINNKKITNLKTLT